MTLSVKDQGKDAKAEVQVNLNIEVFENEWTVIPILPAKASVESALVSGKQAELIAASDGVYWGTKTAGPHQMVLTYQVDAQRSDAATRLPFRCLRQRQRRWRPLCRESQSIPRLSRLLD